MESGQPKLNYEEPQVKPDGSPAWLSTSKVPLRDEEDRVIGVLGTYEDITERRRAEEERRRLEAQLLHTQKLESLGVLAGGIAHDFNNLLVALLGNVELAVAELPSTSPALPFLREIDTASSRAAELCRQMLAYSGRGSFVVEACDVSDVVRETSHMLGVSISKKASIRYDLASDLPPVEADPTQIRQVVMNLITNASEAIGEHSGVISLQTGVVTCDRACLTDTVVDDGLPGGAYVYLEVADTGCGMTPEVRGRMFDPFFSTKFAGRGLGMAAVLGIVRGHRGAIKVESDSGHGTTVRVLFPVGRRARGSRPKPPTVTCAGTASGTVLVVDDDDNVRPVTQQMLERLGFGVLLARDGREGLEVYRAHRDEITCVLLDLTMPVMDGEETLRELRALDPRVRVILSSGYNELEVVQRFAGQGLAGFVQKPYRLADLQAALARTCHDVAKRGG
jgi:signal transduction histidine kinase/ActR/RegA family two-component response regulator